MEKNKSRYKGFTPAQAEANKRYLKQFADIKIRVLPDKKAEIQEHAASHGESVAAFINRAIEETMQRDKEKE